MRRFPREPIVRSSDDARLLARLRSCEQIEINYVEHVRLDGHDHYMAASLLEELMSDES